MKLPLNEIYDILVRECGASETMRDQFLWLTPPPSEFRFMGKFGFGGKFYREAMNNRWYVGCYREDEKPDTIEMMRRANEALEALRGEWIKGGV